MYKVINLYEKKKGENVNLEGVLYLMYKEYKVDEYNAEITGTDEISNVRWAMG